MKKVAVIIVAGIILIPILLIALINKKQRIKFWYRFNRTNSTIPNTKIDQLFTLCVNFLLILAAHLNMTYNEINIWIFCIIWPIITTTSIILNILLI